MDLPVSQVCTNSLTLCQSNTDFLMWQPVLTTWQALFFTGLQMNVKWDQDLWHIARTRCLSPFYPENHFFINDFSSVLTLFCVNLCQTYCGVAEKTQFLPQQQRSGMRCELVFDNHRLFVWKFDAGHENVCGWKTEEDQKNVNIILQLQSARCLKGKILLIGLSSHRDVKEARVMPAGIGRRQISCRIIKGPMCRIGVFIVVE